MVKELHIRESGMMPSSRESRCVWLTPVEDGPADRTGPGIIPGGAPALA